MKHKFLKFLTFRQRPNESLTQTPRLLGRGWGKASLFLLLFALSFGFSSQAWAEKITDTNWACLQGSFYSSNWEDIGMTNGGTNYYTGVAYIVADKIISFKLRAGKDNSWSSYYGLSDNQTYDKNNTDKSGWYSSGNNVNLNIMSANSGWVKIDYAFWGDYNGNSRVTISQSEYKSFGLKHKWPGYENWGYKSLNIDNGDGTFSVDEKWINISDGFNWHLDSDGDNTDRGYIAPNDITKVGSPALDDKCRFTLSPKNGTITITKILTVTYDANGATGGNKPSDAEVLYNQSVRLSSNETGKLVRTGYTLTGWNTKADGTGTRYSLNQTLSNFQSSLKLYAEWTAKTYTLQMDNDGGSIDPQSITVTYDAACPAFTPPTKTGYSYGGYYKSGTTTKVINQGGTFVASGTYTQNNNWHYDNTIDLKAIWTANDIKITFKKNGATGGTDSQTQTMKYDQAGNLRTISDLGYTRTGYDFAGWAETAEGEVVYEDGQSVTNLSTGTNVTLYAKWTAHTTTITLDRNYTDGGTGTLVATYDSEFPGFSTETTADYTRTGYTFNGYKEGTTGNSAGVIDLKDGGGYKFPNNNTYGKNNKWAYDNPTLTAYARWTANNYTITLHYNNETGNTENKSVTFDATATAVTPPIYETNVFEGYFTAATGGTKVIEANGSFALNVDGYTSGGKWVKAQDVDLYAHWITRTQCTITYGITDGSASASGRGAINAKIGSDAATSTGTLTAYTGDEVTISFEPKKGQYYDTSNGYKENGWFDAVSSGTQIQAQGKNSYIFTVTGNASVYVKADPVVYTISTAVAPASTTVYPEGTGTVTPNEGSAGPDVALQLTAEEKAGYDWVNWTLSDQDNGKLVEGTTTTDKTISVATKVAGVIATANFIVHNYSITYEGLEGATHSNPATYTIESETITLSNPANRVGYDFTSWTCGGESISQITQGSTGDKTITATWALHNYTINFVVEPTVGGSIIQPATTPKTDAHYNEPFAIEAQESEGYTFTGWTCSPEGSVEFGVADGADAHSPARKAANVDILTGGANTAITTARIISDVRDQNITITANFEEKKVSIVPTVNEIGTAQGYTANASVDQIGIATTSVLTATNPGTGFTFTGWTLSSNLVVTAGSTNSTSVTVRTNGDGQPVSAEAVYAEDLNTGWRINLGYDGLEHWFTDDFVKKSGESTQSVGYVELDLQENYKYKFKVVKKGDPDKWYGNNGTMTSDNCTNWTFNEKNYDQDMGDAQIQCTAAGKYIFKVDYSGTDPVVSVTYPVAQTFAVTISAGANGSVEPNGEQQVDAFTGISVTATPNPGYRFKQWVTSTGVSVTNPTSATTTVKASQVGTLQATFTTEGMIYFNKAGISNSWTGDVYVYFLNTSYWDSNLGSGSQGYTGHQMTKIGNSDIYYFDYQSESITPKQYIAFTDNRRDNYSNFEACQATYREDFKTCAPVFVARDYKEYKNTQAANGQAVYFSKGYWRTFQSTDPGYDIHIWNNHDGTGDEKASGDFTSTSNLSNDFTFTTNLDANHTYGFKISSCGGTWYGNQGTMTQDCNWEFDSEGSYNNNCSLTTTAAGEYKFTLSCTNGWLRVSVEYPLSEGDYRLAYEELSGSDITKIHPTHHIKALRADGTKTDTVSFFVEKKANAYIYLQKCTAISGTNITWTNESNKKVDLADFANEAGVYNFTLTQTKSNETLTPEVAYLEPYEGPYYIRTDCAGGGWSSYNIKDNEMTQSDVLKRNMAGKGDYDYYFVQWANAGTNVKYCVANNYSEALTDSLKADTYTTVEGHNEAANQTLPADANVRFMWNSTTNRLERAYLNGSTNDADRYLMLIGNPSNETDAAHIYNTEETPARFTNDEVKLEDKGNWTYQIDIQADVQARAQLTAQYNKHVQYFKGNHTGTSWNDSTEQIIGGTDNTKKYGVRIVYDFKTNNMVTGWMPTNNVLPISEQLAIYADVILVRHAQENAQTITFTENGALTDVKTIYSAIELRKDSMVGKLGSWTPYAYSVCNYYVSFPYDVKISEIFGIGEYGTNWQMQYYDGVKRAKIGWFAETSTFWTTLSKDSTLHAHTGYLLQLNKNVLNKADGDIWKNSKDHASVYIYFPSSGEVGGLNQREVTIPVPEHECKIDRTFTQDADKDEAERRNHKITDSHWNMIGLPIFQDEEKNIVETAAFTGNLHYVYQWGIEDSTKISRDSEGKVTSDSRQNVMEIVDATDVTTFTFKAMHGYMVQYYGNITWTGSAITPASVAARHMEEEQNYTIDLQVLNDEGARVSRTYVELEDNASDDFQFNEDVYLMAGSSAANIYSFAGNYDVAANVLSVNNHEVPLGIDVKTAGTYSIHMPSNFSGTATLIDYVANTRTDLQLMDYTVNLAKGTHEGRFALELDIERKISTDFNGADYKGNRPEIFKFIRNNQMFIMKHGVIYNACGNVK